MDASKMWKKRNRIFVVIVFTSLMCTTTVFFLYPDMVWTHIIPIVSNPLRDYLSEHSNLKETTKTETLNQSSNGSEIVLFNETIHSSEGTTTTVSQTNSSSSEVTIKPEKVFVIVAYRDREEHKQVFVSEMNPYLTKKAKKCDLMTLLC